MLGDFRRERKAAAQVSGARFRHFERTYFILKLYLMDTWFT